MPRPPSPPPGSHPSAPSGLTARPQPQPAGAGEEARAVRQHQALGCVAALQALWVLAGRASAEAGQGAEAAGQDAGLGADLDARLDELAAVLPHSLRPLWRQVCGDTRADPPLGGTAWHWLGQGWALAVGNAAGNLNAPGGAPPPGWNTVHRVRPMLRSLTDGTPSGPASEAEVAAWRVWPVAPLSDQVLDALPRADTLPGPQQSPHQSAWQALLADLARDAAQHAGEGRAAWLQRTDSLLGLHLRGQPAYWEGMKQPLQGAFMTADTLMDQQRLAGALAAALWRQQGWLRDLRNPGASARDPELLLVSGQLAPIQDFIFGARTDPALDPHTVLRGRSVFARLVVELACLRACDELEVAPTAVLVASAAKFSLLCANTPSVREGLRQLQVRLDEWCLEHLQGTANVLLASAPLGRGALEAIRAPDAREGVRYRGLNFISTLGLLSSRMAESKLRRFDLCAQPDDHAAGMPAPAAPWTPPLYLAPAAPPGRPLLRCRVDARLPATTGLPWPPEVGPVSAMGALQWALARCTDSETPRLWITDTYRFPQALRVRGAVNVFGFAVAATEEEPAGAAGVAGTDGEAQPGPDERVAAWDLGTVALDGRVPWRGRRRVPLALPAMQAVPAMEPGPGNPLRMALKGDVDRLGAVFSQRMPRPNLARLSTLSRELEEFFTIRLLRMAWEHGAALTPILVGGDDFVFLGEPEAILRFACALERAWSACTGGDATLSIGLSLPQRVAGSSRVLVEEADAALEQAKTLRNAVGFAGECWPWARWQALSRRRDALQQALHQGSLPPWVMLQLADPLQRMAAGDPAVAAHAAHQLHSQIRRRDARAGNPAGSNAGANASASEALASLMALDDDLGPAELLTAMALAEQLRHRHA